MVQTPLVNVVEILCLYSPSDTSRYTCVYTTDIWTQFHKRQILNQRKTFRGIYRFDEVVVGSSFTGEGSEWGFAPFSGLHQISRKMTGFGRVRELNRRDKEGERGIDNVG